MLRWVNLLLPLVIPAAGAVLFRGTGSFATPRIVPAGYAFAVWGPIYLLSIVYGIVQWLPSRANDALLVRLRGATAIAFAATLLWLAFAGREALWATVACMLVIAVSIITAFLRASRVDLRKLIERVAVHGTTGMFAGWITVATFGNLAVAMHASGVADPAVSYAMLVAAIAAAGVLTYRAGGPIVYAGTVIWGLIGIIVRNASVLRPLAMLAAGGAVLLAIVVLLARRRAHAAEVMPT